MSKAILRDNDYKFLELIILSVKTIDPRAIVNIVSILHSHRIDIQVNDHKRVFQEIKRLHSLYGLDFKATEFIKNKETIISFMLSDLDSKN